MTFDDDLVQLQRDWFAADDARTAAALRGTGEEFKAASARLLDLTIELQGKVRTYENPYEARMALRAAARDAPA